MGDEKLISAWYLHCGPFG